MLRINVISHISIPEVVIEYIDELLNSIVSTEVSFIINENIEDLALEFYNKSRNQINGEELLNFLRSSINPENFSEKYVIVVDHDGYVPGLNFIFGIAEMCGNIAIVFTKRLKQTYYPHQDVEHLFYERLKKEILHELGHTLCLEHCIDKRCVMSFSNTIIEVDLKEAKYCTRCIEKIRTVIHWKKI